MIILIYYSFVTVNIAGLCFIFLKGLFLILGPIDHPIGTDWPWD